MKVGTDTVLLGSWCGVTGTERRILDVGTGCGLLALMMAQRCPDATVCGIDIDAPSIDEASGNFDRSPWADRLAAFSGDFLQLTSEESGVFDLIISNPPFFTNGLVSPVAARSTARHDLQLPLDELVTHAATLLQSHGSLAIVTPVEASSVINFAADLAHLRIMRITTVIPVEGHEPKRYLWQLSPRKASPSTTLRDTIVLRNSDGTLTDQHKALTAAFML